jgi:hypothetical protein
MRRDAERFLDRPVSRKKFLLRGGVAALGVLLGRGVFAQPGVSSPAPSPSFKDVPDFPEQYPQIDRARVKLDIVKAAVAAVPNIVNVPRPYKIPLIAHTQEGGEGAKAVLEFSCPSWQRISSGYLHRLQNAL